MTTGKIAQGAVRRAESGDAILTAAAGVDTKLIEDDLAAFTKIHREFKDEQLKVSDLEARLRAHQQLLDDADAEQGRSVTALAGALIFAGFPSRNPFQSFGIEPPSRVRAMRRGDEAKTIHRLVAAVRGTTGLPALVSEAASTAETAAVRMDALVSEGETLQATLREQRQHRDQLIPAWETALTCLKRTARYVSDTGGPALYAAMFARTARPTRRARKKTDDAIRRSTIAAPESMKPFTLAET